MLCEFKKKEIIKNKYKNVMSLLLYSINKILMYLEMLQDLIQISDYKYIYILFKLIIISFIL